MYGSARIVLKTQKMTDGWMGLVVKSLLNVPAVRRIMVRLANAESAIQKQKAQLGTLGGLLRQQGTDETSHHDVLAQERASLEVAIVDQKVELARVNGLVERLIVEGTDQRAFLMEVSAQRAALEAQVAQPRTMSLQEKQALDDKIAKLDRENRLLKVGHGASFEELVLAGKVATGAPYRFNELVSLQAAPNQAAPSVPPLIFIHVPKAGGTTLNNIPCLSG